MKSIQLNGYCDSRFNDVINAFMKNIEERLEVGASFAATVNGEFVVDIWGGYANAEKTRPWLRDTITCVYSTTKVMTALCALILIDRRKLDPDAPVADYWPGFAQAGKEKISVSQVLTHSSGLSGLDTPLTIETMCDWEKVIDLLERQSPWWEPGSACGYHMFTFGFIVGELVRRISGKSIGSFFRDEVALPLNADFHIGLQEQHDARLADLVPPKAVLSFPQVNPDSVMMKTLFNSPLPPGYSDRAWRAAEIPSTNGHGNARSVVKIGSVIACGGEINGIRLLSKNTIDRAIREQFSGTDLVMGVPMKWGLGFGLAGDALDALEFPSPRTAYWGGYGGSWLEMDVENRTCFAYVMNKLELDTGGDRRMLALRKVFLEAASRK